jgi:DNA-binding transcriptional LysR family regulator
MSKLDLEWLALFDLVHETRSVSRAAEQLGIAQATASIALGKLRMHFGDKLFTRTPAGMQPTAYASEIRPSVRQVLDILAQTRSERIAFEPLVSARTFRVGITDIRQVVMLPALVNRLKQIAPGVRIEAETISNDSPRLMEEGRLELAIGYMPQLDAGFFQRTLLDEGFVCLVSGRHPRIRARISEKAFLAESHIFVTMSGTGPSIVELTLAERKLSPGVGLRVPSFLGVSRIVAETELMVVVPRSLGEAFAASEGLKLLESPIAFPSYSVRLHWHERQHADAGNVWLRQVIANLFAQSDRRPGRPARHAKRATAEAR